MEEFQGARPMGWPTTLPWPKGSPSAVHPRRNSGVSGGEVGWDLGWWRKGLASSLLGCFSLSAIENGGEGKGKRD